MSMHRPKRAKSSRRDEPSSARDKASGSSAAKPPKWKDVVGDQPDEAFAPYQPAATFAPGSLVSHAKFGKGVVLEVDGNKASILFEDGVKKLLQSTPS
jgi:hypothetical protein